MKKITSKQWLQYAIIEIVILSISLGVDRILKILVQTNLEGKSGVSVCFNIITLKYYINYGSAFGLLIGQKTFFVATAIIILIILALFLLIIPRTKDYIPLRVSLLCLVNGTTCNLTDRLFLGGVIDYLSFSFNQSLVCNTADLIVTIGALLLVILLVFRYKEDDFSFIYIKSQKFRQLK